MGNPGNLRVLLAAGLAVTMAGGSAAAESAKRAPRKMRGEAVKVLKAKDKTVSSVSDVLADMGGGRFPVLYLTRGQDCTRSAGPNEDCTPTSAPHVAIVKRTEAGALEVEATLDLPTEANAWDAVSPLGWGITFVKDYDGDGKVELMVLYGYDGPMEAAVGDIHYRDLCLVNFDPLSLALRVNLDQSPQASVTTAIETKWKMGKVGDAPALLLTRKLGDYDDATGDRKWVSSTLSYAWDKGTDRWVEVKPAAK